MVICKTVPPGAAREALRTPLLVLPTGRAEQGCRRRPRLQEPEAAAGGCRGFQSVCAAAGPRLRAHRFPRPRTAGTHLTFNEAERGAHLQRPPRAGSGRTGRASVRLRPGRSGRGLSS